jgi:hypothetical protein
MCPTGASAASQPAKARISKKRAGPGDEAAQPARKAKKAAPEKRTNEYGATVRYKSRPTVKARFPCHTRS